MEEKERIHLKDIIEGTKLRDTKIFTVGDKSWWADRISKNEIATHIDCEDCGVEFKKPYTNSRYCFNCESKRKSEKYRAMEFKEWNGSDVLFLYDSDDTYFFSPDQIEDYIEERNDDLEENEQITAEELKLVICNPNHLWPIKEETWADIAAGEEGELNLGKDVESKLKALNEAIKQHGPVSWSPGKFRTTVSF
jgi:hypothetical protein